MHSMSDSDPAAVRARFRALVRKSTREERQDIARMLSHDPAPQRDRDGQAIKSDDGATPEMHKHMDIEKRHLAVVGARKGDQRRTRMERLEMDGKASPRDAFGLPLKGILSSAYAAGERFYEDWALGVCGIRENERSLDRIQSSATPGGPTKEQLDAVTRWTAACQELGPVGAKLVEYCACEDRSWVWISKWLVRDEDTAKKWTCMYLTHLASYYAEVDRARKR